MKNSCSPFFVYTSGIPEFIYDGLINKSRSDTFTFKKSFFDFGKQVSFILEVVTFQYNSRTSPSSSTSFVHVIGS